MPHTTQRNTPIRQRLLQKLSQRVGEQLWDVGGNKNSRLSDLEKAIYESDACRKEDSDEPGPDGGGWHERVVCVRHYGADFCVGGV